MKTLNSITSDASILAYTARLETALNIKLLKMESTLTHYETACSVARPVRSTSTTSVQITPSISTYRSTTKISTTQAYTSTASLTTPQSTTNAPLRTTFDATTSVQTSSIPIGTTYQASTVQPLGK